MAKNILSLQLLRNTTVFASKELAIAGITGTPTSDGVIKLARYTESGATKTIFGIYNDGSGSMTAGYTIYDSYQEVIKAMQDQIDDLESGSTQIMDILGDGVSTANTVTDQLEALSGSTADTSATTSVEGAKKYADEKIAQAVDGLDYTDAAVAGQYVSQVTEADGVISVTRVALPTVAAISETGKPITAVSESLGAISATAGTIDSKFVGVSGFTATDVQGALEEISGAVGTAISGLDYTDTAVTGNYVSKVDEADGVISVTRVALPTVAAISETGKPITAVSESLGTIAASAGTINAEYVNVTGNTFSSSTVQAALEEIETEYKAADAAIVGDATNSGDTLGKLEDRIDALDADAKEYTIKQITTGLSTNVKEAWGLFDTDENQSGATINIYKDSAYKEIYLGTSADTINTTTGEVTKQEGDKQSLNYAYMKADGTYDLVKVDVSAFISESEFASGVTATDHIVRGVVDPTSETFLTVGANGFKLSGVQDAIGTAISGLDVSDTAVAGKYVSQVSETDGKIAVTRADVSAAVLNNYQKGSDSGDVVSGDTINQAISKLENQIAAINNVVEDLDASVSGGTTAGTATSDHIQVIVDEVNGKLTAVTVTETNIADADDLATLSAKTVTEIGSSNSSISATTAATTAADGTIKYDVITDASKIKMSGFTGADVLSGITQSSSITEAFLEVDAVITANEQTTAQALNDLESTKVETIVVNGVTGTTTTGANPSASVTITGDDILLTGYQSGATGEVAATDDVDVAISKLNTKIASAVQGGVTGITASSGITVDSTNINNPVVGAKLSTAADLSSLGIAENAIKFDSTAAPGVPGMYVEYIDAGTY